MPPGALPHAPPRLSRAISHRKLRIALSGSARSSDVGFAVSLAEPLAVVEAAFPGAWDVDPDVLAKVRGSVGVGRLLVVDGQLGAQPFLHFSTADQSAGITCRGRTGLGVVKSAMLRLTRAPLPKAASRCCSFRPASALVERRRISPSRSQLQLTTITTHLEVRKTSHPEACDREPSQVSMGQMSFRVDGWHREASTTCFLPVSCGPARRR